MKAKIYRSIWGNSWKAELVIGSTFHYYNADTMQKAYDWCINQGCNKQNIVVYRD